MAAHRWGVWRIHTTRTLMMRSHQTWSKCSCCITRTSLAAGSLVFTWVTCMNNRRKQKTRIFTFFLWDLGDFWWISTLIGFREMQIFPQSSNISTHASKANGKNVSSFAFFQQKMCFVFGVNAPFDLHQVLLWLKWILLRTTQIQMQPRAENNSDCYWHQVKECRLTDKK